MRPACALIGRLRGVAECAWGEAMDWIERARCTSEDPELFFPVGTTGPAAVQIERAKSVCMQCSVRGDCLEWAMATGQEAGVWGGLSEEERRALRRARRREHRYALIG